MEENSTAPVETSAPAEPDHAPKVGSAVHFVLDSGECRPATVVRVFTSTLCNMQQFTDGINDYTPMGVAWRTSVSFDTDRKPGTWHWPE